MPQRPPGGVAMARQMSREGGDILRGEVTGSDASLNTGRGFPLLAPCLSIYIYKVVSKVDCGNCGHAYLSVRQLPAFPPLCYPTEGGIWSTACCSAILDWLSGSPAEEEQATDCIRFPKPWESLITLASGRTSKVQVWRQLIDGRWTLRTGGEPSWLGGGPELPEGWGQAAAEGADFSGMAGWAWRRSEVSSQQG